MILFFIASHTAVIGTAVAAILAAFWVKGYNDRKRAIEVWNRSMIDFMSDAPKILRRAAEIRSKRRPP